ncbi:hypothetical protein P835_03582 [Citrobacter portucalensis]|nr:hypothetical protein P835_03582 [Citrobacter portucalensis]
MVLMVVCFRLVVLYIGIMTLITRTLKHVNVTLRNMFLVGVVYPDKLDWRQ